jgi:biopolymer transport protein ExbB
MSYLDQLGPLGLPLLICSSLILAVILERAAYLIRIRAVPERLFERLLHSREFRIDPETTKLLNRSLFGAILVELIAKNGLPKDEREGYFSIRLMQVEQRLNRFLPLLRILATVSPLLGLLGTVLGMVDAFGRIAVLERPITPALVADGISQALLTTAVGLMMAIPALIAHSAFQARIGQLMQRLTAQLNMVNLHIQATGRSRIANGI